MKGVIWLTGLSGSGKTTIAKKLKDLFGDGIEYLDGDIVRQGMCADLGFSKEDRDENIKRVSSVASHLSQTKLVVCAFISPYAAARQKAREICNNFIEVYLDCPLEVCEERDVKGLYAKARAGEIKGFTGIDDPYEAPTNPELVLYTSVLTVERCVEKIIYHLLNKESRGLEPQSH